MVWGYRNYRNSPRRRRQKVMEQIVQFWHLKALGYCNRQMRVWCKRTGYSWRILASEGIPAKTLLSLDSTTYAVNAVNFAESTGWSVEPLNFDKGEE
jgi:hypothetical protein